MKQNQTKILSGIMSFLLTLILSMTLNAQSQNFSHLDQAIAKQEVLEHLMSIDQMILENLRAKLIAVAEDHKEAMAEDGTYITEEGTYSIELSEEEANIITLFQDAADVFQYENAVLFGALSRSFFKGLRHTAQIVDRPGQVAKEAIAPATKIKNSEALVNVENSLFPYNDQPTTPKNHYPKELLEAHGVKPGDTTSVDDFAMLRKQQMEIPPLEKKRIYGAFFQRNRSYLRELYYLWRTTIPRPIRTISTLFAGATIGISGYIYLEENPDIDGATPARFVVNASKEVIEVLLNITNALYTQSSHQAEPTETQTQSD